MMMDENTQKLPVVQTTDGSIGSRCVVLLFSYFFLYITIISDYGIVFALIVGRSKVVDIIGKYMARMMALDNVK